MTEDSIIGTEVDGYRIEEVLGQGGMGVVYRAEDVALSRDVALKRIEPSLANDEAFLRRFRSEAQALARVDSPYITGVYALRETEIGLLIVMEYVEGGTVKDLIDDGPMDWDEALPIVKQMLLALEHAHGAEVIHRDIKPQNIMLSAEGTVKVTDFGLAKVHRPDSNKTVTQGVFGTLNYMSPEQVKGAANLDHRSDLYSLGMTIYEMLVGDLPFADDSSEFTKMQTIVNEALPEPTEMHAPVPDEVSALVMKALEKDPDDRFPDAQAMREAFEGVGTEDETSVYSEPEPKTESVPVSDSTEETRVPLLAGIAAAVLLVAGMGYWLLGGQGGTGNPGGGSGAGTALTVATQPTGATVFLDGERVGETPLPDTTVRGDSVRVRVERAGFRSVDTVAHLGGRSAFDLQVPLQRQSTALRLESDPSARVLLDGVDVGSTPINRTTRKGSVRVRLEREGYYPVDTLLALNGTESADLRLTLDRRPTTANAENGDSERTAEPADNETTRAYGTLAVDATPSESVTVTVDGQSRSVGSSVQLAAGSAHEVEITHPQYGRCDTTVTVQAQETHSLTCHFEHDVSVRSDPWANIFLDGENTQESTNYTMRLHTGDSYTIGARILSRPYEVTGGTYQRVSTASYEVITKEEFEGNSKTITLRPSFEPETHGLEFTTTQTESSQ